MKPNIFTPEKWGRSPISPFLKFKKWVNRATTPFFFFLFAQQPAPQASQQPFTIKIDTQLVVETVVVKDKDGKNIEGLSEKDFTVTEDNVPQTISVFQFQKLDDTSAPAPAPAASAAAVKAVEPVVPNQISPPPAGDPRYQNRRLLVLFFDMVASPPPDQLRSFVAADKFIREQMKPADLVAILQFKRGAVSVLQDFTDNREQLPEIMSKLL